MIGENRMDKNPPRLQVPLSAAELAELTELEAKAKAAPAVLGQLAIRQMLDQARSGALPMVPPYRPENPMDVGDMKPPRLPVPLDQAELIELHNLARKARTSPGVLGRVAICGMLGQMRQKVAGCLAANGGN
jgi:hypothetical protein